MDADTGERGENAGRDRLTQRSSAGLAAVVALLKAGATVPIDLKLARNCAVDGLQVMDFVNGDLVMSERCYAVVCQGHGGARSMAWFSPTKWECIMRLIRQKAAQGERRYQRVLRWLDRILDLCIREDVFGIAAAGAGAANEACVLSALWMVLLFKRADFYEGPFLARVEALLAKCDKNLHCAYTNIVAERLLGRYVVDLAGHLAGFEREHGALLRRAAAVAAPLREERRAAVGVVIVWKVRTVDTPVDGDVPLLGVFAGRICADIVGSKSASHMAASELGRAIIDVEIGHIGLDLRPPAYFANDAHYYLDRANKNLGGDPNIPRRGSHTFDHTLGLRADENIKSVTYYGMQVGVLYPAPGHASFARLLDARRPPRGFVDMYDAGARRAFFDLYNDRATVHTGSQDPAKILAKREGEWRCL